jgi:hypothetical protein
LFARFWIPDHYLIFEEQYIFKIIRKQNVKFQITWLFLQADANFCPSGDHATHKTQFLCPLHVCRGVSVVKSQNLTVVSPDPLASCLFKKKNIISIKNIIYVIQIYVYKCQTNFDQLL